MIHCELMVNGETRSQQQMIGSLTPQQHQQLQEQVINVCYSINSRVPISTCSNWKNSPRIQISHHQALTQHQAVASSTHQDVHPNRSLTTNGNVKNEGNCKDIDVKEEQRLNSTEAHSNREKSSSETRLPVISMTG